MPFLDDDELARLTDDMVEWRRETLAGCEGRQLVVSRNGLESPDKGVDQSSIALSSRSGPTSPQKCSFAEVFALESSAPKSELSQRHLPFLSSKTDFTAPENTSQHSRYLNTTNATIPRAESIAEPAPSLFPPLTGGLELAAAGVGVSGIGLVYVTIGAVEVTVRAFGVAELEGIEASMGARFEVL